MGIDLGTSSCKTALFDTDLKLIGSAATVYPTLYPRRGWAEQPAEQWWKALIQTVRELLDLHGVEPADLAGIGIDSMGSIALPVDGCGSPLRPGLLWMDRRSEDQSRWIDGHLKQLLSQINGNHSDPSNIAPKLMWLKENEPEVYAETDCFLHGNGYLVYRLTGEYSMDLSEGGLTQLFDTRSGCWSDELIEACGIEKHKLPQIYQCSDIVGRVTGEAAVQTGLMEGTPVVAGAMDNVASALGAKALKPGDVYIAGGTVLAVSACLDEPLFNSDLHIYHHIIPGKWISAAGVDFGGGSLSWFKDLMAEQGYARMEELANSSKAKGNPLIFIPYMVGQRAPLWNSHTRGVIFGLNPSVSIQDLIRMFMEGTTYGARNILEILEVEGIKTRRINMTGGCTKIDIWPQIFADVLGANVRIPGETDVAALGSAVAAAVGIGVADGFEGMLDKVCSKNEFSPYQENRSYYQEMFSLFNRLNNDMTGNYDKLADIFPEDQI